MLIYTIRTLFDQFIGHFHRRQGVVCLEESDRLIRGTSWHGFDCSVRARMANFASHFSLAGFPRGFFLLVVAGAGFRWHGRLVAGGAYAHNKIRVCKEEKDTFRLSSRTWDFRLRQSGDRRLGFF